MSSRVRPEAEFERFRFDWRTATLLRQGDDGRYEPVSLGSRALAILAALLEHPGQLVPKHEIVAKAWLGAVVEDSNLSVQIAALRRVLDRDRAGASCIQTVSGRGYRFTLGLDEPAEPPANLSDLPATAPTRSPRRVLALPILILGALIAAAAFRLLTPSTAGPDRRQSVIVLPFENSSGDPAQDALASSVARDLIDRIARGGDGPVVPFVTVSAYRGQSVELRSVGQKYNVHFAVTGNAHRQAGRVIVAATVYEIATGRPIWSGAFDAPDTPDGSATIVQRVYEHYWQASVDLEAYRALDDHPDRLDRHDVILIVQSTRRSPPTKDNLLYKLALLDRLLVTQPNDLQGLERKARTQAALVTFGYSTGPAADIAAAQNAADRLAAIAPNTLLAARARTAALRASGNLPAAEAAVRQAIALQPTEAYRHLELGSILLAEGRHQQARDSFQTALRYAGGSDPRYLINAGIAEADLALFHFADAIAEAQAAISEYPPDTGEAAERPYLTLIAAASDAGDLEASRTDLRTFLGTPRMDRALADIRQRPALAANPNLLTGLRAAGMPER